MKNLLAESHFETVCTKCVTELDQLVSRASDVPVDSVGDKIIEGTHYYIENGLMVFTELYHIAKGYCCKSGCRHCAYGYKPDI